MILPFIKRAPTLETLRERATDGITPWLLRLVEIGLVPARAGHDDGDTVAAEQIHHFVRDVVAVDPVSRSPLSAVQVHLIEFALECVDWARLARDRRFRGLDWSRTSLVYPRTDRGAARAPSITPRQFVSITDGGSR